MNTCLYFFTHSLYHLGFLIVSSRNQLCFKQKEDLLEEYLGLTKSVGCWRRMESNRSLLKTRQQNYPISGPLHRLAALHSTYTAVKCVTPKHLILPSHALDPEFWEWMFTCLSLTQRPSQESCTGLGEEESQALLASMVSGNRWQFSFSPRPYKWRLSRKGAWGLKWKTIGSWRLSS